MKKIETTLQNVVEDIKDFYDEKMWQFLTLNGVKLDESTTEIQWIFSKYNTLNEVIVFFAPVTNDDIIPSITDIIPSAIISQREIIDMFGIKVADSTGGLYLDEDSPHAPLSSCGIGAVKNG